MDESTLINYIQETENIDVVSDKENTKIDGITTSLFTIPCVIKVDSKDIPINLLVSSDFPEVLPKFFLDKYDTLGFLPHVEPNSSICFLEKESVYINIEEPKAVFQASVGLVIKTIYEGLHGINTKDFREEFHVFWERNKFLNNLHVMSLIDVTKEAKKIQILKNSSKAILFDINKNIERQKKIFFKKSPSLTKSGIFIPLLSSCKLIPPKYDQKWTIDEFIDWLKLKISPENWQIITEKILHKRPERFEYLILGIPRDTGATILVGVQLRQKKETSHPLLKNGTNWGINLLSISRIDISSILPRGGSDINLQEKRILLVGCGSVGSHVALMLSKTGLGFLDLVDYDRFNLENIQRYSIGLEHIGKNKVDALKDYIDKNFISIRVSASSKKINNFLSSEDTDISKYDLVISATGDPTVNLLLNKKLKKLKIPFLIGWNEPYGIGGHALICINDFQGCYRCLFRDTYNIASFSAPEQTKPFYKKHLGCGEVYTPYSALDSVRTSELVVRLANKFLIGKVEKPEVISWVGNSDEFLNEGYRLSTRYINQTQNDMSKNRHNFINLECPHCRK
ncbi:MAG: hypothetical protein GY756_25805 [bacterium]|nr:hypothetical protein [bacterium]